MLAPAEKLSPLDMLRLGRTSDSSADAMAWALAAAESDDSFGTWQSAASIIARRRQEATLVPVLRIAVLGSYTTTQYVALLTVAARIHGYDAEVYECGYGQFRQEILDPESGFYAFKPDVAVIAVHAAEVGLPAMSEKPREDVAAEVEAWSRLWEVILGRMAISVLQHNFAIPSEDPIGHLATRLPGAQSTMIRRLNLELGERAGDRITVLDCEALASWFGKKNWFDPRYWHLSKQAVSLSALPLLARHTAAVIAGKTGLSKKCLVLDLDNTLWGGVVGEDGLSGIRLGGAPEGESFVAFQEYLKRLKEKGIILAVCSKNNDADAREVFEKHPEMRLSLDDMSVFLANWNPKDENLRLIAESLNIGLDSIVFADDNPAECELIRQKLPQVRVIPLPGDPSTFIRAVFEVAHFETNSITAEDSARAASYRARTEAAALQARSGSLEDFWASLEMTAEIEPFDPDNLPRIAQLFGKTNQFNVTTRRHTLATLEQFAADPKCIHYSVRLRDRFADHGLVGALLAFQNEDRLDIDSFLMSCRVIGRTVENAMFSRLCDAAARCGLSEIGGEYFPTKKNALVSELFAKFGFERLPQSLSIPGATHWRYSLAANGPIPNNYITIIEN